MTKHKLKGDVDRQPLKLFTTKEISKIWNISYWSIRSLVIDGTIKPIVGIGKGWYWTGMELKETDLERL